MAIEAYRHAAKFFGDEGQLIKAIGAAKIILEIDPRNAEALKQLGRHEQTPNRQDLAGQDSSPYQTTGCRRPQTGCHRTRRFAGHLD